MSSSGNYSDQVAEVEEDWEEDGDGEGTVAGGVECISVEGDYMGSACRLHLRYFLRHRLQDVHAHVHAAPENGWGGDHQAVPDGGAQVVAGGDDEGLCMENGGDGEEQEVECGCEKLARRRRGRKRRRHGPIAATVSRPSAPP